MLTCRPALGNSSGGRGLGATAHTGRNCEKLALQGCGEGTFLETSNSLQEKIKKCSLVIITCNPIASSSFQKHSFVAKNLVFLHQCWELLPSIHKGSFYQLVSCANNLHEKFPQIASVVLKMTKAVTGWGPRPKKGDHPKCGAIRVEGPWLLLSVHMYQQPVASPSVPGSSGISAEWFRWQHSQVCKVLAIQKVSTEFFGLQ